MTPSQQIDVEEVEFLTSYGLNPERMCERLGKSPEALARSLYRAGRHDLAYQFDAIRRRERRDRCTNTCTDCGTRIQRDSTRCRPCESTHRWKDTP